MGHKSTVTPQITALQKSVCVCSHEATCANTDRQIELQRAGLIATTARAPRNKGSRTGAKEETARGLKKQEIDITTMT